MGVSKMAACGTWNLASIRLFELLKNSKSVLVTGIGGGYDFMSGLPLAYSLLNGGKEVTLGNLSFSHIAFHKNNDHLTDHCIIVTSDSTSQQNYFPEKYYAEFHKEKFGSTLPIYAFARNAGPKPLHDAYQKIVETHKIDAIVAVDGGTDSVMFGNEETLGTVEEDHGSIAALSLVKTVKTKVLVCLGFGVDTYHGVSHGRFLENVAEIERHGGFLGCFSLSQHNPEASTYVEAYKHVQSRMQPSIVCTSVISALEGHFGDYHANPRTKNSKLFINALMTLYWTFDLQVVANEIGYMDELVSCETINQVCIVISEYHSRVKEHRKILALPM